MQTCSTCASGSGLWWALGAVGAVAAIGAAASHVESAYVPQTYGGQRSLTPSDLQRTGMSDAQVRRHALDAMRKKGSADVQRFRPGDLATWHGKRVMVVDVHGWDRQTADLRWTISGISGSPDEVSGHKRGVPVSELVHVAGSLALLPEFRIEGAQTHERWHGRAVARDVTARAYAMAEKNGEVVAIYRLATSKTVPILHVSPSAPRMTVEPPACPARSVMQAARAKKRGSRAMIPDVRKLLERPITTQRAAKAYIRALVRHGVDYHLDEHAANIVTFGSDDPFFTPEEAVLADARRDELFKLLEDPHTIMLDAVLPLINKGSRAVSFPFKKSIRKVIHPWFAFSVWQSSDYRDLDAARQLSNIVGYDVAEKYETLGSQGEADFWDAEIEHVLLRKYGSPPFSPESGAGIRRRKGGRQLS